MGERRQQAGDVGYRRGGLRVGGADGEAGERVGTEVVSVHLPRGQPPGEAHVRGRE